MTLEETFYRLWEALFADYGSTKAWHGRHSWKIAGREFRAFSFSQEWRILFEINGTKLGVQQFEVGFDKYNYKWYDDRVPTDEEMVEIMMLL